MPDILNKIDESPVFKHKGATFVKSALDYVDSGNFFRAPVWWLYVLIGLLSAFAPFYLLFKAFIPMFKHMPAWPIIVFIVIWFILLAGGIVGFLIWWNRKDQLAALVPVGDDFPVTPVFAHFYRTLSEWTGFMVGVVFFLASLVFYVLVGKETRGILPVGLGQIFILPVIGFVIIFASRFIAEQIRALAAIASNTGKLVDKK